MLTVAVPKRNKLPNIIVLTPKDGAGGVLNIILDYLFIGVIGMGTEGAAIATGLGYSVTTVVGFIIFCNKKNLLHFTRPHFSFDVLKKSNFQWLLRNGNRPCYRNHNTDV